LVVDAAEIPQVAVESVFISGERVKN